MNLYVYLNPVQGCNFVHTVCFYPAHVKVTERLCLLDENAKNEC